MKSLKFFEKLKSFVKKVFSPDYDELLALTKKVNENNEYVHVALKDEINNRIQITAHYMSLLAAIALENNKEYVIKRDFIDVLAGMDDHEIQITQDNKTGNHTVKLVQVPTDEDLSDIEDEEEFETDECFPDEE